MSERFDTLYHATLNVYFEIAAEAKCAQDDDGSPAPAYAKAALDFDRVLTEEEQEQIPNRFILATAGDLKIPIEHVRRISRKEYLENVDEEEE